MSPERAIRAVDRFQQTHRPFAFVFGMVKKYGDDQAGYLAALITYYSFLAIFPLLLVLVTLLTLVAGGSKTIYNDVLHSTLAQFPIIGTELPHIHSLRAGSVLGLVIGLIGLVWGSLGASQAGIYAMAQVWNVPLVDRPGFVQRLGRSLTFLLLLGLFVALSTALDGIATSGGSTPMAIRAAVTVASVVANVVLFAMAFRILTPSQVRTHDLLLGALAGGLAWTVLQSLGTFLVNHELRHAGQLYGFFGIVIGLLWWLYLAVQLTLYAAEINVVCSRRLWPRSIVQPPLTDADREMLSAYLHEARRRPEQEVSAGLRVRKDTAESNGGNR